MMTKSKCSVLALVWVLVPATFAQYREVNISGATLFADFFAAPACTNDYIDVNHNGLHGFDPNNPPYVDQLAPSIVGCVIPNYWWLVQYRGVGSGNGLAEFVNFQLTGAIPTNAPAETGRINRLLFAQLGQPLNPCPPCTDNGNQSGTPVCPSSIDLAVMDVPTPWFVRAGTQDQASYARKPTQPGYGWNPLKSWDANQGQTLKSLCAGNNCLNLNTGNPDSHTVFDTQVAWVPIAIIANRGTGLQNVGVSDMQFLFLTGRMPDGENLIAATRDAGSGTRNGAMNGLCLDPSWGRGDNLGLKNDVNEPTKLGPVFQPTNCGGSGVIELVVQNSRLAVGYTGLAGASRAAGDALAGKYEILNIKFDTRGGTIYVRPTIDSVLDNCDPNTGYAIGSNETFATVGNPAETNPAQPAFMANQDAADYLRNITASIAETIQVPGGDQNYFMPGEFLASQFFLAAAVDCLPSLADPCNLEPNPILNQPLQEWTRANNGMGINGDTPPYGLSVANKVPTRTNSGITWPAPSGGECPYPPNGQYSDGSPDGRYLNRHNGNWIAGGTDLNLRNRIAGDFDGDGVRDINDIETMLEALNDPTAYVLADAAAGHSSPADPVVPEIIGDFNGDGNFDCRDIRYFCDGLALDPAHSGKLNRAAAFLRVDQKWLALTGSNNFFGTVLKDCHGNTRPYVMGASAADVAGNIPWPGARPHGHDGVVDCQDVAYIASNFGNWSNLNDAVRMDLSCDLNGDLKVDWQDVAVVQGWMGGCTCPGLKQGDMNCDGVVDFGDIDYFIAALSGGEQGWKDFYAGQHGGQQPPCSYANVDANGDGAVDFADIDPFVAILTGG